MPNVTMLEWDSQKFSELAACASEIQMPYSQMDSLRTDDAPDRRVKLNATRAESHWEICDKPIRITTMKKGVMWPIVFIMPNV